MATFNSSRFVSTNLKDLRGVVANTREYFVSKGYEVNVEDSSFGSFISLSKGGMFKAVLGMKTSLNVEIKCLSGGISIDAKVGIFGQQIVPSLVMWFVAWPVLLTQITGLVQQAALDDEVLNVIESAIHRYEGGAASYQQPSAAPQQNYQPQSGDREFCIACGANIPAGAAFCPVCGAKQA